MTEPLRRPRVVATDLDGTFLRFDGTVSERSRAAWAALDAVGIEGVIVTARPPRWIDHLADLVGAHGTVLCGNGAFVYDVPSRRVVEQHGFTREETLALARDLRKAIPGIGFAAERAHGPWIEEVYAEPHPESVPPGLVFGHIEQIDDAPVGKLLGTDPSMDDDAFVAAVREVVGERGVVAVSGAVQLAEINPPGVTKAVVLERWCAERGVGPHEVWAFGDMPNDVPMLAWAGASFAVEGGHPDALAAASDRCASNDDDGVARELERLLAHLDRKGLPENH